MHKVLVINGTMIGEKSGTGITLENLFCNYPKEKILQLRVDCQERPHNTSYRTISTPVEFCLLPYLISSRRAANARHASFAAISQNASIVQKGFKNAIRDGIRGLMDSWPLHFRCINREIDCFKPEVIYTCGASIRILKTALYYSKRYSVPIVLHLMDDWPRTLYTTSWGSFLFRKSVLNKLKKASQRSLQSFAISEALAEKYANVLGVKMLPLMNPASRIANGINAHQDEMVRFVYAGSIGLNRWKSLLDIAQVLETEAKKGTPNQFDLYVPTSNLTKEMDEAFKKYHATLHPYVEQSELIKIYNRSDVMVFAESFDENVTVFTRYSLSTKIPEYMGTGNAIIAYLPAESHASSYLRDRGAGLVANTKNELADIVNIILKDKRKRYQIAHNALDIVRLEHSQETEMTKFYSGLQKSTP